MGEDVQIVLPAQDNEVSLLISIMRRDGSFDKGHRLLIAQTQILKVLQYMYSRKEEDLVLEYIKEQGYMATVSVYVDSQ